MLPLAYLLGRTAVSARPVTVWERGTHPPTPITL